MNCAEYLEVVSAHADGALSGAERSASDEHVGVCPRCRRRRARSAEIRDLVRSRAAVATAPVSLRDRIAATTSVMHRRRGVPAGRLVVQGALAATALLAAAALVLRPVSPMELVVADVYALAEDLPLGRLPGDEAVSGELAARGWKLVGGRRGTWGPMRGTLRVFEAADGAQLALHEMEVGPDFELPPGGFDAGGFRNYRVGGVTLGLEVDRGLLRCFAARMSQAEFARRVTG